MTRAVTARRETWPLHEKFTISRGSRSTANVVIVEIVEGDWTGRGECVPYPRYGESVDSVLLQIDSAVGAVRDGIGRDGLQVLLPAGAARNALDCALWDLEAKGSGVPAWTRAAVEPPRPWPTAFTISLGTPEEMEAAAARHATWPLLKLKLGAEDPVARVAAVRRGAPGSRIIVDANEAWTPAGLERWLPDLASHRVELVEQPLPADADAALGSMDWLVPIAADESCHHRADLALVGERYDVVNIKLDKSGGLTEALLLREQALSLGLDVMVGCMVGTSLAMAPAHLLGGGARFIDLDGPLLLARDRPHGLRFDAGLVYPPTPELWG